MLHNILGSRQLVLPMLLALVLTVGGLARDGYGQLPVTELTTLTPAGAKQGSELAVTVGGGNQDDLRALIFSHPGIQATQKTNAAGEFDAGPKPVNNVFQVKVDAKVPAGVYEARVIGHFGASNPRAFVVGTLDELQDDNKNKSLETAREVPVGVTVNGYVDASSRDYYKLALKAGQRVIVDCWAQRFDSPMDATLVLFNQDGKELARNRDSVGKDPLLDITAPSDGNYIVAVYDFIYGGGAGHQYRLSFHAAPHVEFVIPAAGLAGSNESYSVYGRNLPGGKPVDGIVVGGKPLEKVDVKIQLPKDPVRNDTFPVAYPRTALLDAMEYRLGAAQPVPLCFAAVQPTREQEPNNKPEAPQTITVPCDVTGQFYPARDTDWYQFEAKQGQVFRVEVVSHRLGLETDPYMVLQRVTKNDKGEVSVSDVAQIDDPGDRNGRIGSDFDTSTDDPSYRFQVPGDGTYRIMVRDQFGAARSDPRALYRLVIRTEKPDFRLLALPEQIKKANNNQVLQYSPVLRKGGTALVKLTAVRLDGFNGEIDVTVEGLPKGVRCDGAHFGVGASTVWLIFSSATDAPAWSGPIKIVGKAKVGDADMARVARAGTLLRATSNRGQTAPHFRAARDVVLSVTDTDSAVALVQVGDGKLLETSRGGKIEVPVKVARYDGFKENIKLVATGMPGEIKPGDITINGDKTDGKLTLSITNAKAKSGIYTFFLRSDTKVKRPRNGAAIKRAEADQKRLVELVAKVNTDVKTATTAKDQAVKAAQSAAQAAKGAETAQAAKAKEVAALTTAEKQAADKLAKAREAAEKDAENDSLKEAVQAAEKAVQEATAKTKAASEQLAELDKKLAAAKDAAGKQEAAKTAAEKALKDLQDKAKRATAAKTAADKNVAAVKKANAPKDVNIALVSTPIRLRVVDSPIDLGSEAPAPIKQGAKVQVPVKVTRKYGFDEPIEVTLEIPKGVAGISAAKLTIAKGKSEGALEITTAKNAAVGEHACTLRAKFSFNKIAINNGTPVVVKVEKAEEEKPEEKPEEKKPEEKKDK